MVSLEPKDSDGHVIKATGTLTITALEILPGGIKKGAVLLAMFAQRSCAGPGRAA